MIWNFGSLGPMRSSESPYRSIPSSRDVSLKSLVSENSPRRARIFEILESSFGSGVGLGRLDVLENIQTLPRETRGIRSQGSSRDRCVSRDFRESKDLRTLTFRHVSPDHLDSPDRGATLMSPARKVPAVLVSRQVLVSQGTIFARAVIDARELRVELRAASTVLSSIGGRKKERGGGQVSEGYVVYCTRWYFFRCFAVR